MTNNNDLVMREFPVCLTVSEVAAVLRISKPIAYQLIHREDFPAV